MLACPIRPRRLRIRSYSAIVQRDQYLLLDAYPTDLRLSEIAQEQGFGT